MRRRNVEELTVRCHAAQCVNTDRCQVPFTQLRQEAWNELPGSPQDSGHCHSDCPEARKEGIQPVCSLPSIDPPKPKHSSYLPGRGPHSGQFLSTSLLEPSDGIRAYGAHSGSNQTEIQWMGGILQYTLCQRLGIQELKGVLKGLPTQEPWEFVQSKVSTARVSHERASDCWPAPD